MHTSLTVRRSLLLLFGMLLFIVVGIQAVSAQATEGANPSVPDNPQTESSECRSGSEWMWTYGPMLPEVADQVRQTLNSMGMDITVTARSFGETDSCGDFRPYAVDFSSGRANIDQALVYDAVRARTIIFGGLGVSGYLSDTWEYDGVTWVQVIGQSPQKRDSHAMVFDSQRGVTVLFGGYSSSSSCLNDTWEYTYDHGNTATVLSNCDDFANYPNLGNPLETAAPVTCSRWNCDHLDYFGFRFDHLPSSPGCGTDGVANNWGKYFSTPALALDPSAPCQ